MVKPVIFFSHASIDRNSILPIREEVIKETRGTIDIFMSGDGASIPFGRSWQVEIEKALKQCLLMFAWVTPNSRRNSWLHFEAGYAYSQKIPVVPIGFLGQKLDEVPGPLSLIQGFDVVNPKQLNNIFSIMNDKLRTSFESVFNEKFLSSASFGNHAVGLLKYFDKVLLDFVARSHDDEYHYVPDNWQNRVLQILESDGIAHEYDLDCILGTGFSLSRNNGGDPPELVAESDPFVFDEMKASWARITQELYGDWANSTICRPVLNEGLHCPRSAVSVSVSLRNTEVATLFRQFEFRGIRFPQFGDGASPNIVIPHDFTGAIPFYDLFALFEEKGLIQPKGLAR